MLENRVAISIEWNLIRVFEASDAENLTWFNASWWSYHHACFQWMVVRPSSDSGKFCHWPEALKCYVCDDFFSKPRILPCGHTFCSGCLSRLRQVAMQEFNKSRDRNAHRRGDCGFFTCPWPNCHYSMKIMNLGRWSLRNKAASRAVAMVKKQQRETQV